MNATYGIERPPNGLATFQAALRCHLSTQGIGLRPQPWAPFSRPVGPAGLPLAPVSLAINLGPSSEMP